MLSDDEADADGAKNQNNDEDIDADADAGGEEKHDPVYGGDIGRPPATPAKGIKAEPMSTVAKGRNPIPNIQHTLSNNLATHTSKLAIPTKAQVDVAVLRALAGPGRV